MIKSIIKCLILLTVFGLLFSLYPPDSYAGSASISWTAPTTNDDGSPIDGLTGFNVHRSSVKGGPYIKVSTEGVATLSKTVTGLEPGTYYFVVTAFNKWAKESKYSNEISRVVDAPTPSPPSCK
jgi:hypothetical protein